jgi:hypothetical protein
MFASPGDRSGRFSRQVPMFHAYLATNVNMGGSGTVTNIPLDTVVTDTHYGWSTADKCYYITKPGYWFFSGSLKLQSNGASLTALEVWCTVNGSIIVPAGGYYKPGATAVGVADFSGFTATPVQVGDIVRLVGEGEGAVPIAAQSGLAITCLQGFFVRSP